MKTSRWGRKILAFGVLTLVVVCTNTTSQAVPVDLSTWTSESYPAVSGFSPGNWVVSGGNDTVTQTVNGQPTLYYSDFSAFNTDLTGTIRVNTGGDDDFVGFALGFNPGDSSNASADYLLVDWKQGSQSFDFGAPANTTPGGLAPAGLAVSRVIGLANADEFWQHEDLLGNPSGGLTELARGTNLGNTGWNDFQEYEFQFIFRADMLQVFVDGVLEIDINGSFNDGRLAFYNFSQSNVVYSGFTVDPVPPTPNPTPRVIPEPATAAAGCLGLGAIGLAVRRRRVL